MNLRMVISLAFSIGLLGINTLQALPAQAALVTSATTQNLFTTLLSKSSTDISTKLTNEYATWKTQRIGYLGTTAYVKTDGGSPTVLTEGMGWGLAIAVQMNDRTLFDKLYKFVQTYMLFTDTTGTYAYAKGYHRWMVNTNGTPNTNGNFVAPDGEEWIAGSLQLASRRWGNTGAYNYMSESTALWHKLLYPENAYGGFCIDPTSTNAGYHIVRFGPYNAFTDPSYIVNGFYALFADAGTSDSSAYSDICSKGHNFLQNTPANPSNSSQNWGLHPDYADWNGNPVKANSSDTYGPVFSYDAFRTTLNMAIEVGWTNNNSGYYWQVATRRQDQFYYYGNTVGATVGLGVGGYSYGQLINSGLPVSLIACNAAASALYSWSNTERADFVNKLWTTYHPSDYYGDNLYILGLLVCGGRFRNAGW